MGWTAAEGDRFSTPHPRDHPPYGPASVVTSTRLRGFFWCRGASNRPAGATGHRTRTGGQWTRQGAHQVHRVQERAAA